MHIVFAAPVSMYPTVRSTPVVPNRGAAAPWGAIYSAQGCRGLTRFFTISLKIHFHWSAQLLGLVGKTTFSVFN